jgi:hypothetical protein
MLIGGNWVDAQPGNKLASENPYLGEFWANVLTVARKVSMPVSKQHAKPLKGNGDHLALKRGKLMRHLLCGQDLIDGTLD